MTYQWTDGTLAVVRELWRKGYSSGQILGQLHADQFGNKPSRSALMGRIRRMKATRGVTLAESRLKDLRHKQTLRAAKSKGL